AGTCISRGFGPCKSHTLAASPEGLAANRFRSAEKDRNRTQLLLAGSKKTLRSLRGVSLMSHKLREPTPATASVLPSPDHSRSVARIFGSPKGSPFFFAAGPLTSQHCSTSLPVISKLPSGDSASTIIFSSCSRGTSQRWAADPFLMSQSLTDP